MTNKIVTWDEVSIEPKSFKQLSNEHKNFSIKLNNNTIENAFRQLLKVDEIINGCQSSISENDFAWFEEENELDCVFGTSGYTAKYDSENSILRFIFVEGGLE